MDKDLQVVLDTYDDLKVELTESSLYRHFLIGIAKTDRKERSLNLK
nr:hypothetical protein [Mycoplasmopsis bovis]QQH18750.1 hypothetical protein HYE49_00895 [Mycoplasmopsis bovis]